jgi:multicomponent Na+:H+ antiporter subunit F
MITLLYTSLSLMLLATMVIGFVRIFRGPLPTDCILAVLFFSTTGVGVLLLLSLGLGDSRLIDVALVFALLSAVMGTTYVKLGWLKHLGKEEPSNG